MDPRWLYRATVVHVVDGDTIDLDVDLGFYIRRIDRFRLIGSAGGVDTPELHASDPAIRERARAAKARMAALCPAGAPVFTVTEKAPAQDGFGRWLCQVITADGLNVGDTLLAEGLAVPYRRGA